MLPFPLTFLTLCLLGIDGGRAIRIPFEARSTHSRATEPYRQRLRPRANTTASVKSISNTQYLANITVGGGDLVVILDTGSSDLWLSGNIPTKHGLGQTATVKYAVGKATGEINAAQVNFAGYGVPDQAFIYVQDASVTGIDTSQFNGLLGLGPSMSSEIRQTINQASGDPFLDRVFRQNTSTPNFITFLLDRAGDSSDPFPGQLTIGEVVQGFENITNQPKIPVRALPGALRVGQHWSGLIDALIGPDGQKIKLSSLVPGTDGGKLVTIFDSGFTLPQVPRDVSDAIYGRIQGASYDTDQGYWTIPCDQEVNVTVVLGGQNYPIHPLDTASQDVHAVNSKGDKVCVGTFQPISTSLDGTFDCVMGMAFLRNTYTYINFGDFVEGNPQQQGNPYVQLLSVTDPAKAHQEYVRLRMNNVDSSGDSSHSLVPSDKAQHSPSSTGEKVKNAFFRYWPIVAGVAGLLIVIGLVWLIFRCCCGRRVSKGGFKAGAYRPLHDPSSGSAVDMHAMGPHSMGPPPQYTDPYHNTHHH